MSFIDVLPQVAQCIAVYENAPAFLDNLRGTCRSGKKICSRDLYWEVFAQE